jgi:microsomal dipeptidase-like Zn-dependent dipeptidase
VLGLLLAVPQGPPADAAERPWWEPANRPALDSEINVTGAPFRGTDAKGNVRGFVDAHNHVMTNEAFGGRMICGKPFSDEGITDALKDCPEHYPNGEFAVFDQLTGQGNHEPIGWPTFKDWPAHDSLTHQQNYYAWIERAWRAGQRVMVTDLTSNGVICSLLPRDRGCDEMDSVRLQADKTYEMQDYIDEVYGGAGRGFFRIVTTSEQARTVIEDGKLAVILGVETSEPFGCKQVLGAPQCSKADIDRGLDELRGIGVRSMFLCHKFDNALCGVRFDSGTLGTVINIGQFLSTGTFWQTEKCAGPQQDNPIGNAVAPEAIQEKLPTGVEQPTYDNNARCNVRGLTRLGEYAVHGLMERGMMLELDHMSVKAADRALDILESVSYPGALSTHSWMDVGWTERLYRLGGFATAYDFGSKEFVANAMSTSALRKKYGVGLGFGSDLNGVGGWPAPRGEDAPDKIVYPYRSVDGGSLIDRQVTGQRTWDLNVDGVAHYGLIPDWIQDIRNVGGESVVQEMFRGAESYLDTWGAAESWTEPRNLAAGSRATASSAEWPTILYGAPKAVDGNPETRWASDWSDNQWLRLDLRTSRTIGRVVLDWEAAYGKAYRIDLSTDGAAWRTVFSTDAGGGGFETATFAPTTARYVRIHGLGRGTTWGYSLREVRVMDR